MKKRLEKIRFWLARHLFGDILCQSSLKSFGLGQKYAYTDVYQHMKSLYGKDAEEWCADAWSYVESKERF